MKDSWSRNRRVLVLFFSTSIVFLSVLNGCRYRAPISNAPVSLILRSFIAAEDYEKPGYGGYSYVLLKQRPSSEETYRYHLLLRAYVNCLRLDTTYLTRFSIDPGKLNITYWPLVSHLQIRNVTKFEIDTNNAQYFIDNFDYERATNIISKIVNFPETEGPFIVCSRYPLTSLDESVQCRQLLIFDLTKLNDYKGFQKTFDQFESKVKRDVNFATGCVYKERFAALQELISTEPPDLSVCLREIIPLFLKGASP